MKIATTDAFVNLFSVVMEQAYKDLESNDERVREEAKAYIENMKKDFA